MIFIWGTKGVKRKSGYVADYCPVCHEITVSELFRMGSAGHFFFLTLGQGSLLGHFLRCTSCGMQSRTDDLRYASIERKEPQNIEALIEKTFPNIRTAYAQRLAFDQQLLGALPVMAPEERRTLLAEPFLLLNPAVEELYAKDGPLDKQVGFGCLGTLLFVLVVGVLAGLFHAESELWMQVLLGGCLVGVFYTVAQLNRSRDRALRTRFAGLLARALSRLRPSREELVQCIDYCKGHGMLIGKKLRIRDLEAALGQPSASVPPTK